MLQLYVHSFIHHYYFMLSIIYLIYAMLFTAMLLSTYKLIINIIQAKLKILNFISKLLKLNLCMRFSLFGILPFPLKSLTFPTLHWLKNMTRSLVCDICIRPEYVKRRLQS